MARTSDPYHILVSEVMLQQTQVDRVLPKYHEWLDRYPSLAALATADEDDVTEHVAAARLQHPAAPASRDRARVRRAIRRRAALRPRATLLSFKGIGAYTAGAIRSFAFGQRAAILDTNVARVLYRVFVGRGDPKAHAMRKQLWALSEALVPHKHVFDFNQALMDFGATVCAARKPRCDACPMTRFCRSYPKLSREACES